MSKALLKRIHVNQHAIRANIRDGGDRPVVSVRTYKGTTYGHDIHVRGESRIVYPDKPLSCGARVWVETRAMVVVLLRRGKRQISVKFIP